MEYPDNHKQIVEDLMNGRFILSRENHFEPLKKEEDFYTQFFLKSFGYQLIITQEYGYLISEDTDENISRDISILFAILCYELDKEGKNFLDVLQYSEFSFEEVNLLFENSSYIDLIQTNKQLKDIDARRRLLFSTMNKKNIIEKISDDKFFFTPAYKVFIDFAKELAESRVININIEENAEQQQDQILD
jgi:hypothetical protein